jgi:hypothetical protein
MQFLTIGKIYLLLLAWALFPTLSFYSVGDKVVNSLLLEMASKKVA